MSPTTAPTRKGRARYSREESRERIVAAAIELVKTRSYQQLSVAGVMERAGFERTIFYRHYDDLADLLRQASREAIERLFSAELDLSEGLADDPRDAVRAAMEPAVSVYRRHGPLLRALAEAAAAGNEELAAGQEAIYRRFDELVVNALRGFPRFERTSPEELGELARALNVMNTAYLIDAFGREPRVSTETALDTVTEIWAAVISGAGRAG